MRTQGQRRLRENKYHAIAQSKKSRIIAVKVILQIVNDQSINWNKYQYQIFTMSILWLWINQTPVYWIPIQSSLHNRYKIFIYTSYWIIKNQWPPFGVCFHHLVYVSVRPNCMTAVTKGHGLVYVSTVWCMFLYDLTAWPHWPKATAWCMFQCDLTAWPRWPNATVWCMFPYDLTAWPRCPMTAVWCMFPYTT